VLSVDSRGMKQLSVPQPSGQRIEVVVRQSKRGDEFVCDMEEGRRVKDGSEGGGGGDGD
jgi:hypothetical protein